MILTVVDYFSKVVHFVALPKLHSAKETANQLVFLVFCLHGIPLDIVSDKVHSLFLMSGKPFAKPWEPLSAYAMVFIHIRMVKQKEQTRTWRLLYDASLPLIPPPGGPI